MTTPFFIPPDQPQPLMSESNRELWEFFRRLLIAHLIEMAASRRMLVGIVRKIEQAYGLAQKEF